MAGKRINPYSTANLSAWGKVDEDEKKKLLKVNEAAEGKTPTRVNPYGNANILQTTERAQQEKAAAEQREATARRYLDIYNNKTYIRNSNINALNQNMIDQGLQPIYTNDDFYKPENGELSPAAAKGYSYDDNTRSFTPNFSAAEETQWRKNVADQKLAETNAKREEAKANWSRAEEALPWNYNTLDDETRAQWDDAAKSAEDAKRIYDRYNRQSIVREQESNAWATAYDKAVYDDLVSSGAEPLFNELYNLDYSSQGIKAGGIANAFAGGDSYNPISANLDAENRKRETEIRQELLKRGYSDEQIGRYYGAYKRYQNKTEQERVAGEVRGIVGDINENPAQAVFGGLGMSAASIASAPLRGLTSLLGMALDDGAQYSPYNMLSTVSNATQQQVEQNINDMWMGEDESRKNSVTKALATVSNWVYSAGTSSAESLLTMTLGGGPVGGGFLMGLGAGTEEYQDALDRGLSKGQALATGLAAGIFEEVFETLSLENLSAFKAQGKHFLTNLAKQMFVEGSEEFFTDIANETYDVLANGELSKFEAYVRQQMAEGVSEEEAKAKYAKDFAKQLGESFIVGALSGGFGGGNMAIQSQIQNREQNAAIGQELRQTAESLNMSERQVAQPLLDNLSQNNFFTGEKSNARAMIDERLSDYAPTEEERKKAPAISERQQKREDRRKGAAISAAISEMSEADRKSIREDLISQGYNPVTATYLSQNIQQYLEGRMDEDDAKKLLKKNGVREVLDNLAYKQSDDTTAEGQRAAAVQGYRALADVATDFRNRIDDMQKKLEKSIQKKLTTEEVEKRVDENKGISPVRVESIEKGKVTLALKGGTKVELNDSTKFVSKDIATKFIGATALGFDATTTNKIIAAVDTQSATSIGEQLIGLDEAVRYGRMGLQPSTTGMATVLTDGQRQFAYDEGQRLKAAEVKARQDTLDATYQQMQTRIQERTVLMGGQKGTVKYVGTSLEGKTERQVASMAALTHLAKNVTKNDVVIFESKVGDDGKTRVFSSTVMDRNGFREGDAAPNGFYENGTIYIDLNAGKHGEGAILWTAAHEMTHWMKDYAREKYEELADYLVQTYTDSTVEDLIRSQKDKAKRNGNELSDEEAFDEVVADAMSLMLTDTNAMEKIEKLRAGNPTLWEKIKAAFQKIFNAVKRAYKGLDPETQEAQMLKEMMEPLEKLSDLFAEGIVEAGRNYEAAAIAKENAIFADHTIPGVVDGIQLDEKTDSVAPVFDLRSWTGSEYVQKREEAIKRVMEMMDKTDGTEAERRAKATKYIDDINSIAKMIADDKVRLDYEAAPDMSAFVGNVEYGGSLDFSTLCAKRRLLTGTLQAIQERIGEGVLTPIDILNIRNMMKEKNYTVNCGLCYVEGSRTKMGTFAQEFIKRYQNYNPNADWIPTMKDVFTPDGIEDMRVKHPEAYAAYEKFWNNHGVLTKGEKNLFASQQKPKMYQKRTNYKGEILDKFDDKDDVKKKNENGGIRIQSFSDFELVHMLDMMQVIMDMSRVGLAGQAYTKVPEFAWAFGNTGLKINLSLIAKGVDENGKLIFDDVEGMPHEEAFNIRGAFSKNVGTILVTFDDAQLKAAMADDRIDFIIPFHRSQWTKAQYADLGLPESTKDYTYQQNEKFVKPKYHEYMGRLVKDKAHNYMPNTYWDFKKSGKENAEEYLRMCFEDGKRPKFYKLLDQNADGSYSLKKDGTTDGYWKLLIDFKMYDNDGVGSEQMPVRPVFNMGDTGNALADAHSIQQMLNAYEGGHNEFPVADDIVEDYLKKRGEKDGVKYSLRGVDPVQPSSDKWRRTFTTEEAMERYPNLWNVAAEESEKRNPTQIASTQGTYRNIYNILRDEGFSGKILDASSGLGLGTQVGRNEYGFDVDDIEPYPDAGYTPKYKDYSALDEKYDAIISSAVLNVLPQDQRDALVVKMGELLNDGGRMFITTRGSDVENLANSGKNIHLGKWEWIETARGSYQKGFTDAELLAYLQDALGDGFLVQRAKDAGVKKFNNNTAIVVTKKGKTEDIRFSTRDTDGTDARSLLASALESTAQTEQERTFLTEYQQQIEELNEQQARLADVRKEIHDMMFAKGKRDEGYKAKLASLRDEATKLANRINIADKRLLRLESTAPIKNVLAAEKKKAADRARARGQKAQAEALTLQEMRLIREAGEEYNKLERKLQRKDKSIERLEADIKRRQEARQTDIDRRKSTDLRHRIAKIRSDFVEKIGKDNGVPPALADGVIDVCNMIDPTGENQNSQAAQKYRNVRQSLLELKAAYESIRTNDKIDADFKSEYSQELADRIALLADAIGNKPLREMSRDQLEDVYDALVEIRHTLMTAKKQLGIEDAITNYQAGMSFVKTMQNVIAKKLNRGLTGANGPEAWVRNWLTNPLRAVHEMTGYDEGSQLYKLFDGLAEGLRKGQYWEMTARKTLEPFQTGKNRKLFEEASQKPFDFGLTDLDGKPLKISKMQAMQILLTYERETNNANRAHLANTIIIPDVTYIAKGQYSKALDNAQKMAALDEEVISKLREGLSSEFDLAFMDAAREVFKMSADAVNETSLVLKGRAIATEKSYIPYEVFGDVLNNEFENVAYDISIANMGMTKSVQKNSTASLVMRGLDTVMDKHLGDTAKYYGLSIPVRNFTKAYNTKLTSADSVENNNVTSAKNAIRDAWGTKGMKLIEQAVADVQGSRRGDTIPIIGKLRSNLVQATLASNVSVWIKQAASYLTAGSILSYRALMKGLAYLGTDLSPKARQNLWEEIDEHTVSHYIRRQGLSIQELAEFSQSKGIGKKLSKFGGHFNPMNWIQSMDLRTTAALWVACKAEVKQQGIEVGSEAYWDAVTELYDKVIEETQPMYDPIHRAEITKNRAQNFILFQTQPIQNSGILREATMKLNDARKEYGIKSEEAKEAGKGFAKAVISQLASHTVFALMTLVGSGLVLHKMGPYRDDEEEVTAGSVSEAVLKNILKAYTGAVFPVVGNYVVEALDKLISKNNYDVVSDMTLEAINSTVTTLQRVQKKMEDGSLTVTDVTKAVTDISKYFGIPASNAYNIVNGIISYANDIKQGKIFGSDENVTTAIRNARIYNALAAKDEKALDELKKEFKTSDEWHKAIQTIVKDRENDQLIAAAVARQTSDLAGYEDILKEIHDEGVYTWDDITAAADSIVKSLQSGIKDARKNKENGWDDEYEKKVKSLTDKGFSRDFVEAQIGEVEVKEIDDWTEEPEPEDTVTEITYGKAEIAAATQANDAKAINAVVKTLTDKYRAAGKDNPAKEAQGDVKEVLYAQFLDGTIDDAQARKLLASHANIKGTDLYWLMREWAYKKQHGKSASYSMYFDYNEAVRKMDLNETLRQIKIYTDHGVAADKLDDYISTAWKQEYIKATGARRQEIYDYVVAVLAELGVDGKKRIKSYWK